MPSHNPTDIDNLNLKRRPLPGLLAMAAAAPLRALLPLLRRPSRPDAPVLVFASYMVGDFFMALPALRRLAARLPVKVLCRPDCVGLARREGLDALPFDNAFFTRRSPARFLRSWRAAWRLRALPVRAGIDLDAHPASALWLRVAGTRALSFKRPYAALFDETFALPAHAVHQADRDGAVVDYVLGKHKLGSRESGVGRKDGGGAESGSPLRRDETTISLRSTSNAQLTPDTHDPQYESLATSPYTHATRHPPPANLASAPLKAPAIWLLSVWTRKPEKNWPLELWNEWLENMVAEGVAFGIVRAPDGDDAYREFLARWAGRIPVVEGSLDEVAGHVRACAGVVATDNFLGHMAGYYGKPVLWINVSSPAAQVVPRGPRTVAVEPPVAGRAHSITINAVDKAFGALRAG